MDQFYIINGPYPNLQKNNSEKMNTNFNIYNSSPYSQPSNNYNNQQNNYNINQNNNNSNNQHTQNQNDFNINYKNNLNNYTINLDNLNNNFNNNTQKSLEGSDVSGDKFNFVDFDGPEDNKKNEQRNCNKLNTMYNFELYDDKKNSGNTNSYTKNDSTIKLNMNKDASSKLIINMNPNTENKDLNDFCIINQEEKFEDFVEIEKKNGKINLNSIKSENYDNFKIVHPFQINNKINLDNISNKKDEQNEEFIELKTPPIKIVKTKCGIDLIELITSINYAKSYGWMNYFKSVASTLIYNIPANYFLEETKIKKYCYIFEDEICEDIYLNNEKDISEKFNFLYFSYRSNFTNMSILNPECNINSDCGWGCMLRCSQMILSHGLMRLKKALCDHGYRTQVKKELLALFYDNITPFHIIKDNEYYKNFIYKYNNEYNYYGELNNIICPLSIHVLCKLGNCYNEFTSDVKMMKAFIEINEQLFDKFKICHFEGGYINEKRLYENFCKENLQSDLTNINSYKDLYIFKKPGIIFITLRLGISKLDPIYYNAIPLIFRNLKNNIGFISGKKNRAFYFIGIKPNNDLLFVDPHFNQEAVKPETEDINSYLVKRVYSLKIDELSSQITLGISITCKKDIDDFTENVKAINNNESINRECREFIHLKT